MKSLDRRLSELEKIEAQNDNNQPFRITFMDGRTIKRSSNPTEYEGVNFKAPK